MHKPALNLHDAIEAVAPIECVSVERWDDRGTWRVTLAPDATDVQRAAAEAVMRAFDPSHMLATEPAASGEAPRSTQVVVAPVVKDEALAARVAQLEAMLAALAQEARRTP